MHEEKSRKFFKFFPLKLELEQTAKSKSFRSTKIVKRTIILTSKRLQQRKKLNNLLENNKIEPVTSFPFFVDNSTNSAPERAVNFSSFLCLLSFTENVIHEIILLLLVTDYI